MNLVQTLGALATVAIAFLPKPSMQEKAPSPPIPAPIYDDAGSNILDPTNFHGRCNCDPQRIADLESLVAEVETSLRNQSSEIASLEKCHTDDVASLIKRIEALESRSLRVAPPVAAPAPTPQAKPLPTPQTQIVEAAPVESYKPRWNNFDGKSRMQHAIEDHGLNVAGMSEAQVLRQLDADHDRFGGNGHAAIRASRSVASAPVVSYPVAPAPMRIVQPRTVTTYSYPQTSNCPGGVCPTGPSASVRTGWYPGKLLGR